MLYVKTLLKIVIAGDLCVLRCIAPSIPMPIMAVCCRITSSTAGIINVPYPSEGLKSVCDCKEIAGAVLLSEEIVLVTPSSTWRYIRK